MTALGFLLEKTSNYISLKKFFKMTTEQIITQVFQAKIDGFDREKVKNEKLKFLGIDSIQFVNVIITICKELGISPTELNGNIISMENTFDEFLVNFETKK